jgi:predicted AlkP superfamily pyrophosphatase or phosphodiesterase
MPASTGASGDAMKSSLRSLAAGLLAVVIAWHAAGTTVAQDRTTRGGADRHVILVSIDGFAAFHLNDATVDLPNIRALAAAGARAASSESVFPTVTHPSHTTLITGVTPRRPGVVENTVTDRRSGRRFHITNLPRRESIRVPTLFDALHQAGRRTAAFFWPETREDPSIDDNVAEVFREQGGPDPDAVTPGLLAELRTAGVPIDTFYALYDDTFGQGAADIALTRAAAHVFAKRKPALTAVHLLVADKVQHEFGAAHYLSRAAMTTADYCVGLLREAVAAAGMADRTTFVIAADHGFVTARYEVNVAPALAEPALEDRVRWTTDKWYLFAETTDRFDPKRDGPALDRVLARVAALPSIARVIGPADVAALGYPDYADNPYVPGQYIVVADIDTRLVIDAKDRSTGRRLRNRPYHGHGYLPDHPAMHTALVLSGAGVAQGVRMGHVRNLDVAPTIASLLGVALPSVEGRVLKEALLALPFPARQ